MGTGVRRSRRSSNAHQFAIPNWNDPGNAPATQGIVKGTPRSPQRPSAGRAEDSCSRGGRRAVGGSLFGLVAKVARQGEVQDPYSIHFLDRNAGNFGLVVRFFPKMDSECGTNF